jgi:hypothetical protein
MKINSLLLPHPVLGREDDVAGEYRVKEDGFVVEQDDKNTKLSVQLVLQNKTLEDLVLDKRASFNIEVECPSTFYRKSFLFSVPNPEVEITKSNLRGKVAVSFYVTSNVKIPNYRIAGANADYSDTTFEIEEGDVLAFAGSVNFNAEILWEDLRRIFNIMKIRKDDEREEGPAIFELDGDIIFISLAKKIT